MRVRVDERGRDDRERAALLHVAGRTEEPLRRVERPGVDTTRHDPARRRRREVVGPGEARDAVEEDGDVLAELDESLGALDGELGDVGVLVGGAVERGRDHLAALHVALHVGDLFGPLVDEQHHEVHLGVVALDRPDDLLHDRGLADLRRRHDQAALALADRREQVDDPAGEQARVVEELEAELLVREQRREVLEPRAVARAVGRHVVDLVDAQERRVLLVARGRAGLSP